MALSNMKNEPRREITESVIGILALIFVVWAWRGTTIWILTKLNMYGTDHVENALGTALGMLGLALGCGLAILAIAGLAHLTHGLGDALCNILDGLGLQTRPVWRPYSSDWDRNEKTRQFRHRVTGEIKANLY